MHRVPIAGREDGDSFLDHPGLATVLESHSRVVAELVHLHCTELPTWDLGVENPPVKMMAFFHPSRTMTRAQSQDYWTNKHVAIGMALNNPQRFCPRYVQNHTLPDYHNATPGPTQSIFPAWGDMGSSIGGISIRLENIEREIESR
jgi:hypothetical protein